MSYDFEQFKKDVKKTGEIVGEKAKEISDIAKLKVDINSKERELNKLYCALGKVYFVAHQNDDEETVPEAVMFRGIKRAEAELAGLKADLDAVGKSESAAAEPEQEPEAESVCEEESEAEAEPVQETEPTAE